MQYGGTNVLSLLDRLKGRMECVHLKDYRLVVLDNEDGTKKVAPTFAPVGDGTIDFVAVVNKMQEMGVKYYLVEQDDAAYYPNPLEQVQRSINYIKKEL